MTTRAEINRQMELKRQKVLEELRGGASAFAACRRAETWPRCVDRWRKEDEAFDAEYRAAVAESDRIRVSIAEDALLKRVQDGNIAAIIFLLTNRAPDRWSNRQYAEVRAQVHHTLADVIRAVVKNGNGRSLIEVARARGQHN